MLPSLETDHLLHEAEVAKILSLKVSTLRRWRWEGKGPQFYKFGSAVRYSRPDIDAYIANNLRFSTSDPGSPAA